MLIDSPSVERLIEAFRRLPGVGKRSAERYALYLLGADEVEARQLSDAISIARDKITSCSMCRNLTEQNPCSVCSDEHREHTILCVVEQPSGAMAIERGGTYKGLYHVLHGVLNPLEGIGPDELNINGLIRRIQEKGISEVIVATNATAEGETTAMYLSRQLTQLGVEVTRIAHGVPMGSGLEFADDVTLTHAIEGRKKV